MSLSFYWEWETLEWMPLAKSRCSWYPVQQFQIFLWSFRVPYLNCQDSVWQLMKIHGWEIPFGYYLLTLMNKLSKKKRLALASYIYIYSNLVYDIALGLKDSGISLPPANEVWGKVICLQACVCPQGGCLVGGGACSGGCAWSGGCLLPGGAWWRHPPGRPLLRAVRILPECILVSKCFLPENSFSFSACCLVPDVHGFRSDRCDGTDSSSCNIRNTNLLSHGHHILTVSL